MEGGTQVFLASNAGPSPTWPSSHASLQTWCDLPTALVCAGLWLRGAWREPTGWQVLVEPVPGGSEGPGSQAGSSITLPSLPVTARAWPAGACGWWQHSLLEQGAGFWACLAWDLG